MTDSTTHDDFLTDAHGRLVPISKVKPVDLLRDQLVRALHDDARRLSVTLAEFRRRMLRDIEAFVTLSAEQYDAHVGGAKGNLTLMSYDGRLKITRQIADHIVFDERLQAAKQLIDECVHEWSAGANANIQALVTHAFQVDKAGKVSTERVLGLRRLDIDDPKWLQAMRAISDSLQVVGTSVYVRFYERASVDSDQWLAVPLDITNARESQS